MGTTTSEPAAWFTTNISYAGESTAELSHGREWQLHGPCELELRADGALQGQLRIHEFIENGERVPVENGARRLGDLLRFSRIVSLTMGLDGGTLVGHGFGQLSWQIGLREDDTTEASLRFTMRWAVVEMDQAGRGDYWVLALSNFLVDMPQTEDLFALHPLRLRLFPLLRASPTHTNRSEQSTHEFIACQDSRLVAFWVLGGPGFIEPLVDYEERRSDLVNARCRSRITAIMVMPAKTDLRSYGNLPEWLPQGMSALLGLCSGNTVGIPWLEVRDVDRRLVRRLHFGWSPCFTRGRPLVTEETTDVGRLIPQALNSRMVELAYFRFAMSTLVKCLELEYVLEDKLARVCSALDALCVGEGLTKPAKLDNALPVDLSQRIKEAVGGCADEIDDVARQLTDADREIAQAVAKRVRGCLSAPGMSFARALCELMLRYGLRDPIILQREYEFSRESPIRVFGGSSFAKVLSRFRAMAVHDGNVLPFPEDDVVDTPANVGEHLTDVLARLLLKMMDYRGKYVPPCLPYQPQSLDWVTSTTDPSMLGYR